MKRVTSLGLVTALTLSLISGCAHPTAPHAPVTGTAPVPVPPPSGPAPVPTPPPSTTPAPTPLPGRGLVEITFSDVGTAAMSSSATTWVPPHLAGQGLQATTGDIQLEAVSRGSFTSGTRGNGGYRYLYATFKVRNAGTDGVAYTTPRSNLTFMAASTAATLSESALSTFKKFDGTNAAPSIAPTILPTHGMRLDRLSGQPTLMTGGEDFQIFTEDEVDPARFSTPTTNAALGVTRLLPYGFVVRNTSTPGSRSLPANPGVNQFDGTVTFAVKVPLQANASDDPFTFSMMFKAVDDPVTRVTESVEEQGAGTQAATRAAALGTAQVAALCGSTYAGTNLKFIPSVTVAGTTQRLSRLGGDFILHDPALPAVSVVGNTSVNGSGLLSRVEARPLSGAAAPTLTVTAPATSARGGDVTVQPDGRFTFNPKVGDGNVTDTLNYSVSDGACTTPAGTLQVPLSIGPRVWYVNNTSAAGTADGRRSGPFSTLSAAQTASGEGDIIYVYRGDGTSTGQNAGITLKANQTLLGQGSALVVPFKGGAELVTVEPAGQPPVIGHTSGAAVTLAGTGAGTNQIAGLSISAAGTGATGIAGSNFGQLNVANMNLAVSGGPALNLAGGQLQWNFSTLSSTNSTTTGLTLKNITGTVAVGGGTISGATGTAVEVDGGTVAGTVDATVQQANAAPLLRVVNGHTGALTFTENLTATNGTGLQFENADGTYEFRGATTLNGGDAGIDVTSGSGGTIRIADGTGSASITNPTNEAVRIDASSATFTYGGSISKTNGSAGITVSGNTAGTVNFTGSSKIITSSGTNAALNLTGNAGATINFTSGGLALTSANGTALSATGGGVITVTGPNNTVSTTGTAPNAVNFSGVTLGANGVNLSSVSTGALTSGAGFRASAVGSAGGGAFIVGALTVAGSAARGLDLTSNAAPFTFTSASVNGTAAEGIALSSNTGAVAINGGTVGNTSNTAGDALSVSGGTAPVTVAASLSKSSAGRVATITGRAANTTLSGNLSCTSACTGVSVTGNTGGTHTFSGTTKTLTTGTNPAVTLSGNTGATVNFLNGNLTVTTTTGNGLSVAGGGTLTVEGPNNTVSSAGGTALSVQDTAIGAGGLNFKSVTATGGPNGIFLKNTGATAGLSVTGDGTTPGSGGTIQNSVGADGVAAGNGVYLDSTSSVSLKWMTFTGSQNNGVYGTGVRGFTLDQAKFTGTTGTSGSGLYNESAVQLVNVGGAVRVTNSQLDGAAYNAVNITNTSGTAPALNPLVISNNKVLTMQGSAQDVRSTALLVNLTDGSADMQIDNNDVRAWWGNAVHVLVQGSASGTARIRNNFADNTNGALAAAGGIWVAGGNLSFNISGNTVRHTNGTAISADRTNAGTLMQGTIEGNAIGVSGDNNSGSAAGSGIFASHHGPGTTTLAIRNNTIRQVTGQAAGVIRVLTGDATGFGGSGTLNATITGNDLQQTGSPSIAAHMAILATIGTQSGPPNDTDQACLDIGGSTAALRNTILNINTGFGFSATSENRIRVNQRFGTTSRYPGYTGAQLGATSQTDLATYLLARNTASNATNANTSTGGFTNTAPANSPCPQPAL
ncbi:beta strand repeat-containing protein [Deinococcus radiotolerans]|uniref:Uncharacterized protein n=1 Tax=Deinococcus radiotolerans TaxID=1309407 RepID=A0ABQ2FRH8_9DEIO|nr:hypothetical protein [Deinococcus radiotolerans]GGL19415.1 hypothetical protein GCM10010844_42950 [Deinococcus radiotolerans]